MFGTKRLIYESSQRTLSRQVGARKGVLNAPLRSQHTLSRQAGGLVSKGCIIKSWRSVPRRTLSRQAGLYNVRWPFSEGPTRSIFCNHACTETMIFCFLSFFGGGGGGGGELQLHEAMHYVKWILNIHDV